MPFALLFVGLLLVIIGYRGTHREFLALLQGDFTGPGNFIYWVISIIVIGSVGYIPKFKSLSDGFLILVLLVLFIGNKGFFDQFTRQIGNRFPKPRPTPMLDI